MVFCDSNPGYVKIRERARGVVTECKGSLYDGFLYYSVGLFLLVTGDELRQRGHTNYTNGKPTYEKTNTPLLKPNN